MGNCGLQRYLEVTQKADQLKSMIVLLDVLKMAARDIRKLSLAGLDCAGRNFGRLLQSLPNELLAETMRYACSDTIDLLKLSHVNRRFRDVARSMSNFWTHISSDMPTRALQLYLKKGNNAPLHVLFDEKYSDYGFEDFYAVDDSPGPESQLESNIHEIARSCSRWKDIEFLMPESMENEFDLGSRSYILYEILSARFHDLVVPRLESLSLSHQGCAPDNRAYNTREEINSMLYFYRSWKAPNLRRLSFTGLIPTSIPGASIEVLSLDIHVDKSAMDFSVALQDLISFLQETPSLQKLEIRTYSSGFTREDHNPAGDLPTVVLENLQVLEMLVDQIPPGPENGVLFASFVRSLRLPNLTTLSVKLALEDESNETEQDVTELMNDLIPNLGTDPRLENLSVFVYDSLYPCLPMMSITLDKYPCLRTLTVGINGELLVTSGSALHPNVKKNGSLEQVNLLACTQGVGGFLAWIADQLRDSDGLRRLKVAVRRCESTSERRLLKLVSPGKLEFEEDSFTTRWEEYGFYCGGD